MHVHIGSPPRSSRHAKKTDFPSFKSSYFMLGMGLVGRGRSRFIMQLVGSQESIEDLSHSALVI